MNEDLNELRKIAGAATQADWYALRVGIRDEKEWVVDSHPTFICSMQIDGERAKSDAEHIATFNPETVLALLSRLEQAEKNADTYQTLYEQRAESLEQAEQAVQRVREMSAHRKEIRLDYVDLIDLDRALDGDGRG